MMRAPLPVRARRSRGMTLVEVMISFAILVAGLVSIFAILNAGFRSHKRAVNETESSLVAESVLAEMRAQFAHGIVPKSDSKGVFVEHPDYPSYQVNRQVVSLEANRKGSVQAFVDREYFVHVEVRWLSEGDNKSINVDTVMFFNRPF
jgi:Tfp pilus assembly protein PilV